MNIRGVIYLNENNFPIMENTFFFSHPSEIPEEHLSIYGDENKWAMRGFSEEVKITDHPYSANKFVKHHFSKKDVGNIFEEINLEMDKENIPSDGRIFFVCRVFSDKDVRISGHIFKKNGEIFIDVFEGNKPSGTDWNPSFSFKSGDDFDDNPYSEFVGRIFKDVEELDDGAYLDFTLFNDNYFFYHDLSFH